MKNWNAIAEAIGVEIPAGESERVTKPLDSLEAAFRPLVAGLAPGDEPAIGFEAEAGGQ